MTNYFKIEQLFEEETVILMGAGASMDYGFPDRVALRKDIITRLKNPIKPSLFDKKLSEYWIKVFDDSGNAGLTLDSIIYKFSTDIDEGKSQRFYILGKISEIISEYEELDNNIGWIDLFQFHFLVALIQKLKNENWDKKGLTKLVSRLKIVTLNYDRCFGYHFRAYHRKNLKKILRLSGIESVDFEKIENSFRYNVSHPHGSIGSFPNTLNCPIVIAASTFRSASTKVIQYGDKDGVEKYVKSRKVFITNVDESEGHEYTRINSYLKTIKNVVILGLSNDGLSQSKFIFPNEANYYIYSGSNFDEEKFKKEKGVISVFNTGEYCDDFVKNL